MQKLRPFFHPKSLLVQGNYRKSETFLAITDMRDIIQLLEFYSCNWVVAITC